MYIDRIDLRNFRIYHGENSLAFPKSNTKNVFIVSGNNGYGKTTLLTALIWGLYGKLMVEVDEKFRKEIYEAGGYKKYALSNFNRLSRFNYLESKGEYSDSKLEELKNKNVPAFEEISEKLLLTRSYSVSIYLTDLNIPSFPCNNIEIIRTFDTERVEDSVKILIDGQENELTKTVGDDIFISDFILPKEIAKFFFFDAEKIVSLAEIKSVEDKRALSHAYSEVLGIKKYEDLKTNLEDLRIRFRRNSATEKDRDRLSELQKESEQCKKLLEHNHEKLKHWEGEREINRQLSEQLQEKLIREGNSLNANELADLKKVREKLSSEANAIKSRINELLDIAPFAISGELFFKVKEQLLREQESKSKSVSPKLLKRKQGSISLDLANALKKNRTPNKLSKELLSVFQESFSKHLLSNESGRDEKILLAFDEKDANEFEAIYNNLKHSFSQNFKILSRDYKNNRIFFNKVIRKITQAEAKESDLLIKEIRANKNEVDEKLQEIEKRIVEIHQEVGGLQRELSVKSKVISELAKKVNLDVRDKVKDETAKRLVGELELFISQLKLEKKKSLEGRIKKELNLLMHKKDFIQNVGVVIEGDLIDINLFDKRNELINKESLSKGEQQLYATSLLKALVDESNIKFPVFIDSPLQKFDKKHSINIIRDFYPNISEQVVLFPLLEKELSQTEFETLSPKINKCYLISNISEDKSTFTELDAKNLFHKHANEIEYVQHN